MVDASSHIGLVWWVIGIMDIPDYLRDEAFSEGLVVLTQAAIAYNPDKGVPPHFWLIKSLRWGLSSWKRKVRNEERLDSIEPSCEVGLERLYLNEVLRACQSLSKREYVALMGSAIGYQQAELSRLLRTNGIGTKRLKEMGREKILKIIGATQA